MIDSHCHLAGREFAQDLDRVIARAKDAGLQRCLVILGSEDEAEFSQAVEVSRLWPDVAYAIGVHPHNAHKFAADPQAAAELTASRIEATGRSAAVGEIGLDYHYDFSPRDVQQAVFRGQLRLARCRRLPVVIHTREAEDDTLRIIDEESGGDLRGVFHCFTGDAAAAGRALRTGFYVSIPGIVTFPKSTALLEAARGLPEERLLIETDSPYLAPIPYRGKRNEPAYVVKTWQVLAVARGVDQQALGQTLVANFDRLFQAANSAGVSNSAVSGLRSPS